MRANLEAMLTMENDKAEWQKTLEQHDAEMRSIASYNEKLEAEVEKLKEELATSSTLYSQNERCFSNKYEMRMPVKGQSKISLHTRRRS